MKSVLRPIAVWTLTSCLTTLQFASLAQAQDQTNLQTAPVPVKAPKLKEELATPSFILAPQKGFEVGFGYSRSQQEFQFKGITGKVDAASDEVRSEIGYAITPLLMVGADIGYQSQKTKADMAIAGNPASIQQNTIEGVGDPALKVGGRMNFGQISAIGQLGYKIQSGTSERQIKSNQDIEQNAKTGGDEISPRLAVFRNLKSEIMFGGAVEYTIRQPRKTKAKDFQGFSQELKETGGNVMSLSAFIETPQTTHSIGGALKYQKEDQSRRESLTTTTVAATELVTASLYGNIRATKNISVIPALTYGYYINDKQADTELSSQTVYGGALNLRLMF